MKRVLVTGAAGFVGRTLAEALAQRGYAIRSAARAHSRALGATIEQVLVGNICGSTEWQAALEGVDFVIHAAARAHVLHDAASNDALYLSTNVDGTRALAIAARRAGIRRFVYLSSVKVNGEETTGRAYTADDEPHPRDIYGKSKWLGERALFEAAGKGHMEPVVVRSPLVYGPGVRANFLRLLRLVDAQRPLPLGAISNRRSLVSVWNLADLLINVLENPAAAGRAWMVSDGDDLSTPELIRRIAAAMGRQPRLLRVPVGLLRAVGRVVGRTEEVARLCGSLAVDTSTTCRVLGWAAPVSVDEGLRRTVAAYLDTSAE